MSRTAGNFSLQRLGDWGVVRVFGYPGDGITRSCAGAGLTAPAPVALVHPQPNHHALLRTEAVRRPLQLWTGITR